MKNGLKEVFNVDSVMRTLILCILTFGSYLIYKLYQFSKQINEKTELKISILFIFTAVTLFIISLSSLVYAITNFPDLTVLKSSIAIHIISSIFDLAWIIMIRNRINLISDSNKGDEHWLNPVLTSLFHVFYMQHKINQALVDNR